MPDPAVPTPARLAAGVISAGAVGSAVGAALEHAGHVVSALVARSEKSRRLAAARLPEARIAVPVDVARTSELLILAVPDPALATVVRDLADAGAVRSGHIVLHTAGAYGWGALRPFHELGAVVAAAHPSMTFTGTPDDLVRLPGCSWGVTAPDEIGLTVAQSLVVECGGRPVSVDESRRGLYHAALAHGSNHLVTLVADAADVLRAALGGDPDELAPHLLRPLLEAALDRSLESGDAALTGPVKRGDAVTVSRHLDELETFDERVAAGYRALALRTAQRVHAGPDLLDLLDPDLTEQPR